MNPLLELIRRILGNPTADTLVSITAKWGNLDQSFASWAGSQTGHTLTTIATKWGNITRSLDLMLGSRWDVSGDLGTDIATLLTDVPAIQQGVNGIPVIQQSVFTGNLANAGSATICALDAIGAPMRGIRVKVFISGATAGLGITPAWHVTRYAALTTFTEQTVPSLGAQHILVAAVVEDYSVGDLAEDLRGELRIASNGNDAALTFEAVVTYEQ